MNKWESNLTKLYNKLKPKDYFTHKIIQLKHLISPYQQHVDMKIPPV